MHDAVVIVIVTIITGRSFCDHYLHCGQQQLTTSRSTSTNTNSGLIRFSFRWSSRNTTTTILLLYQLILPSASRDKYYLHYYLSASTPILQCYARQRRHKPTVSAVHCSPHCCHNLSSSADAQSPQMFHISTSHCFLLPLPSNKGGISSSSSLPSNKGGTSSFTPALIRELPITCICGVWRTHDPLIIFLSLL